MGLELLKGHNVKEPNLILKKHQLKMSGLGILSRGPNQLNFKF